MSSDYLTFEELLYALEHEGMEVPERTIRFWISKGLLEKPLRKPFQIADGRVRYFPNKVVGEIADILRYQAEGWKLTQIKLRLRSTVQAKQSDHSEPEEVAKRFLADFLSNGEFRDRLRFLEHADPSTPEWRKVRNFLVARLRHLVGRKQAVRSVTSFMIGLSKREIAKILRRPAVRQSLARSQAEGTSFSVPLPSTDAILASIRSVTVPEWTGSFPEPILSRRIRVQIERLSKNLDALDSSQIRDAAVEKDIQVLVDSVKQLHMEVKECRAFLEHTDNDTE